MSRGVDLHTHTTVSDGALEPEELVARAAAEGIGVLAITDHDAIDGVARARAAAPAGLEVLSGAELTCHLDDREAHVLAYGVDVEDAGFRDAMAGFGRARAERARRIVERLNAHGIELDFAEVEAVSGTGTIARPHVGLALVRRGHVDDLDEAFRRWLGHGAPAFVPKPTVAPADAFALVREAGGVPSLAHPGTFRRDELIPALVEAGLEALEVRHTEHGPARTRHYARMADELGLLPTGGSDFHGTPGHRSRLGHPEVPTEWASRLVDRIQARG